MREKYLAIEIGGTKLQIAIGDGLGNIEERMRFDIEKNNGAAGIKKQIEDTLKDLQEVNLSAVGVGFGGPVDWRKGKISLSFHVEGWSDFNLVHWLRSIINVPVYIDNDANVAALGEARYGAGKDYKDVFYVTLGSGVGGGFVKDNLIYHGAIPGESEMGHIRLDRNGTTMESNCSGWAVDEKIKKAIVKEPSGILAKVVNGANKGEAKFLKPAIEQGDNQAKKILQETGGDIAFGLSHVVHLFHPEIIILGGGFSLIGEPLRAIVEEEIQSYVMKAFLPGPLIRLAQLKEDAVPVGALELARQRHLNKNDC